MRVLVCGGRDYNDDDRVFEVLDRIDAEHGIDVVIHGGATGADTLAAWWADSRGLDTDPYPADWGDLDTPPVVIRQRRDGKLYNAAAGGIRNQRMLDEGKPDLVVAFPGGKGTNDMVSRAVVAGIDTNIILK